MREVQDVSPLQCATTPIRANAQPLLPRLGATRFIGLNFLQPIQREADIPARQDRSSDTARTWLRCMSDSPSECCSHYKTSCPSDTPYSAQGIRSLSDTPSYYQDILSAHRSIPSAAARTRSASLDRSSTLSGTRYPPDRSSDRYSTSSDLGSRLSAP